MTEPLFYHFNFFCREQKDSAEPDGKKPSQKKIKEDIIEKAILVSRCKCPRPKLGTMQSDAKFPKVTSC